MLLSVPRPRPTTNPYVTQLFRGLEQHAEVAGFSWRTAVQGSFDVFHVHWPEALVRSRRPGRTWLRRLAFLAVLLRMRLHGVPVVRTAHNLAPHESRGRLERAVLRACDRQTALWIRLNGRTPTPPAATRTIPHGHYRDWFGPGARPAAEPGRLLFFGHIRRYKQVDALLDTFRQCDDPHLSLRIVGDPFTAQLRRTVELACQADPRCSASLGHVDDPTLADEVASTQLVVLPYREMHNSGAALLALSLDRPVLVPRSGVTEDLAAEVGPGWVHLYDGALEPHHLRDALLASRSAGRSARPDLSAREWADGVQAHLLAYRAARATGQRCVTRATPTTRTRRAA